MEDKRIVIIGNGIAGVTTARHVRKRSNVPITIISAESKHFFSRTALMYIYMGHMKYENTKPYEDSFWEKNRIELIQDRVEHVNVQSKQLHLRENGALSYNKLVIASGSKTSTFGWEGLDLKGVQGLYSLQDLQSMQKYTAGINKAVVIGGGLIGVEMAEMLITRGIEVDFLVREDRFWGNVLPKEEGELISRHIQHEGVNLLFNSELDRILDDGSGKVKSIITKSGEKIPCDFVGITTGVKPNVEFIQESGIELDRGILVNEYLQSNIEDIYAVGDCAQLRNAPNGRRSIEAVWYVGKMMGEVAAANICGQSTKYQPGPWFNSAKFFHIEYQTYGLVPAELSINETQLYWESKDGQCCIKIVYDKADSKLLGINAFGIRLDHRICDSWLRNQAKIETVVSELQKADFNPEFYKIPFKTIQKHFQESISKQIA